jgi:biotin transport system substrate-specific component
MTTHAATLRAAVLPRTTPFADAATVLAGAVLIALAAQVSVPLPFTPVPVTGQTFGILLVGGALGSLRGLASAVLYVAAGAAGAPVYADHASGCHVLTAPPGGYLVGCALAAGLVGLLAERRWDRTVSSAIGAMLTANVLVYLCGLPWLARSLGVGWTKALELGLYPFVAGDLLKLYLAAALLPATWRLVARRR